MKKIKESQLRILENLHIYRFLTARQMRALRIGSRNSLYERISELNQSHKKYIDWVDFGTRPEIGRIDRLMYLTKHGAALLAEALQYPLSQISYPKGRVPSYRDFTHRTQTVDLHISARTWCEANDAEMDFFQTYFEHQGGNNFTDPNQPKRRAVNTITLKSGREFIPDCIFKIIDKNAKPYIFTAEIYRNHNTKRTHAQLSQHLQAIGEGTISTLFSYSRAVPVLVICEKKGAMQALQKRLAQDPAFSQSERYFLFKTIQPDEKINTTHSPPQKTGLETRGKVFKTLDSFIDGWETCRGEKVKLMG